MYKMCNAYTKSPKGTQQFVCVMKVKVFLITGTGTNGCCHQPFRYVSEICWGYIGSAFSRPFDSQKEWMVGLNNAGFHGHAAMPQQMMGKLSQGCVANWPQGPVAKLPQGRVAKLPLVHAMSASCAFICPVNIIIYLFVRANSRACICNNCINKLWPHS